MKNVKSGYYPAVCLDAGHYGKYNRSPVVKDYYESDMVWKLHNYLATELEAYGIQVKKTRTAQAKDLALYSRGAASMGCDLFISMHSNACDTESVDRPVGIYLVDDNCGAIDEQSREIAGLLAETVQEVMETTGKAQTYSKKSGNDRDGDGLKNDDYYGVLYGAHQVGTPGIILEHSFHTNTRAAKWLLEDTNLRALAKAEAQTIARWFGVEKQETTTVTLALTVLKKGAKGDQVRALQALLTGYGYSCGSSGVDGDYGSKTEAAAKAFQQAKGLDADGIVGPKTWAKLLGT